MLDNYATLIQSKNLLQVLQSEYYQENFVKRYIGNLPLMALEVFNLKLTHQQVEIVEAIEFIGGKLVVPSGHGIGKTKIIGFICSAVMLLFPMSIMRVQAPKAGQVTKFTFKEVRACFNGMEEDFIIRDKTYPNRWAFLKRFFVFNTTLIYVKGFKQEWYIEPATAPRGDPTNLSGQHNAFYGLIFEEMSGIPDDHVKGSLGGLSEDINFCVGFSQWTTNEGIFNDCASINSVEQGGTWKVLKMNSEESPNVTTKQIQSWKSTYTESEYGVRCEGNSPTEEEGKLLNSNQVSKIYAQETKEQLKTIPLRTLVVSTDVAYTGERDSGVTITAMVGVVLNQFGDEKICVIIKKIDVYHGKKNGVMPVAHAKVAFNTMKKEYLRDSESIDPQILDVKMPLDATSGGRESYSTLEEIASTSSIPIEPVKIIWGEKIYGGTEADDRFVSNKPKAFVDMREAISDGRLYCETTKHQTRLKRELLSIPLDRNKTYKYFIPEMKKSPDIADAIAQIFLGYYDMHEQSLEQINNEEEEIVIDTEEVDNDTNDTELDDLEQDEEVDISARIANLI